jgi:hypothetical protein
MVTQGHLMESNAEAQGELPKIYIMKTNFYSRMCVKHVGGVPMDTWDYPGVRRWTKKVDVFAMDYVRPLPAPRLPTTPRERERERERERGRERERERGRELRVRCCLEANCERAPEKSTACTV